MGQCGQPWCCHSTLCLALGWSRGLRRTWLWVWLPGYRTVCLSSPGKPGSLNTPNQGQSGRAEPHYWLSRRFLTNCPQQAGQTGMCGQLSCMRRSGGVQAPGAEGDGCMCLPASIKGSWRGCQQAQLPLLIVPPDPSPGHCTATLREHPTPQHPPEPVGSQVPEARHY